MSTNPAKTYHEIAQQLTITEQEYLEKLVEKPDILAPRNPWGAVPNLMQYGLVIIYPEDLPTQKQYAVASIKGVRVVEALVAMRGEESVVQEYPRLWGPKQLALMEGAYSAYPAAMAVLGREVPIITQDLRADGWVTVESVFDLHNVRLAEKGLRLMNDQHPEQKPKEAIRKTSGTGGSSEIQEDAILAELKAQGETLKRVADLLERGSYPSGVDSPKIEGPEKAAEDPAEGNADRALWCSILKQPTETEIPPEVRLAHLEMGLLGAKLADWEAGPLRHAIRRMEARWPELKELNPVENLPRGSL